MNEYVSYEELKEYLQITELDDDQDLRDFCEDASRALDAYCGRRFYPLVATRYYDDPPDDQLLLLDDDLLELSSLTTGNGSTVISSDDCFLMCGTSYNETPYDRIALDTSSGTVFTYSGTPQKANEVVGIWGYHDDWARAWEDANDTVQTDLTASGTTLAVSSAGGTNIYGETPRFRVQDLIRIDNEYLYIAAKPQDTLLTVVRGVNGSTATTHEQGTTIYIYRPMRAIAQAIKRWAAYLYRQRDTGIFETTVYPETGTVVTPEGMPKRVRDMVAKYRRVRRMVR